MLHVTRPPIVVDCGGLATPGGEPGRPAELWSELPRRGVLDAQGVIGLFVGIELMVNGWTWLILAFALKGPAAPETPGGRGPARGRGGGARTSRPGVTPGRAARRAGSGGRIPEEAP